MMLDDLVALTEKLQRARGEQTDALASLVGMTRADIKRDLPALGVQFIDSRAAEMIPDGRFEGTVSLYMLLSVMRDAWKAGAAHEARTARNGS